MYCNVLIKEMYCEKDKGLCCFSCDETFMTCKSYCNDRYLDEYDAYFKCNYCRLEDKPSSFPCSHEDTDCVICCKTCKKTWHDCKFYCKKTGCEKVKSKLKECVSCVTVR